MDRAEKDTLQSSGRSSEPRGGSRGERRGARSRPRATSAAQTDRARFEEIRAYVESHLDRDLTLAVLARRAGMSASCFSRWFREQTGRTPHAFVLEARVARAKALLRRSELPLLEVALAAGFSSQSCLNVTFRRRAGMTPAEYRSGFSKKAKDARAGSARSSRSAEPAPRVRRALAGSAAKAKGAIE